LFTAGGSSVIFSGAIASNSLADKDLGPLQPHSVVAFASTYPVSWAFWGKARLIFKPPGYGWHRFTTWLWRCGVRSVNQL